MRGMETTDAELLAEESSTAFRALYDRHAHAVTRFLARRTGSRDVAYDLAAEVFAQAWLSRRSFRDLAGGSARPWLLGIARNVLAASVRRRRLEDEACARLGIFDRVDRLAEGVAPEESWLDGLDGDLEQALAGLPADQRRAVELRVLDDLPYEAVADHLGTTPAAARVRVHRALVALRVSLARSGRSL